MDQEIVPSRLERIMKSKLTLVITGLLILLAILIYYFMPKDKVDFNTQVKPIFNKNCIVCHGGVRRKADFSLLFRSEALAVAKSGKRAIIPGDPDRSEMIRRLTVKDPEERMPYQHEPLSKTDIAILRQWIKEGAVWGDHWAYLPVEKTEVTRPGRHFFGLFGSNSDQWARNDIDYFILDKLQKEHLHPAGEADKAVLLRRVSLDLVGLPPSSGLAAAYLQSKDEHAYERLVDSLLASPHFGEHWASMWLDIARYADSKGYEKDDTRPEIWRYRDWLIRAFNQDKPYDRFLTEQIAGDLLPGHSDDQFLATGFHRNTMTNDEGGTDNEEFRTAAVLDRVNTTWVGLMGSTFACVQCHSHPYDPFKQEEYYSFMAFFNDTRDEDTYADYPLLREFGKSDSARLMDLEKWISTNISPKDATEQIRFLKTWQPAINSIRADQFVNSALEDTKYLTFRNQGSARFSQVDLNGKDQLIYRYNAPVDGGILTIRMDSPDGPILQVMAIGKTKKGWEIKPQSLPVIGGKHDLFFHFVNNSLKKPTDDGLQFDWLHFGKKLSGESKSGYAQAENTYWELLRENLPGIPVMMENPADMHRPSQVFERGNWLVKGKVVEPDVPHSLNPFPAGAPRNRLGLTMWLTDKKNPLVSRTIVNRLWEKLFGKGLVETLEDMGTQGAAPTHRELIDYLSWKLMNDDQWSLKKCLKYMVLSATYRQDSRTTQEKLEKDPYNKYYARGPRNRLSAEQIRDQALCASGLMSSKMYGPPVMPWQPQGIWLSPYNDDVWKTSPGEDQYRRAIYTYWKRTAPYPSMITFDGASREVCTARRILTNTPLQALVGLNDSAYVEASRKLAFRMLTLADPGDKQDAIRKGYELLMFRPIEAGRLKILSNLYDKVFVKFQHDPESTCEMVGQPGEHNNPTSAAYVVVAEALLNLDEVVTKN